MGSLLEVTGLRKSYGPVRAVDGLSLSVGEGETLGLVGESGCGKTTVLRCLVRLVEPDGGALLLEGRDLRTMGRGELRRARRTAQYVFQDPFSSLDPRMRVGEQGSEVLAAHGLGGATRASRRARVAELLALVGLPYDARDRFPHAFSGGQRQRIGLARALAAEPRLLLLDEPISALDVSIQAQILTLLMDLQKRLGLAMLLVAHDLLAVRRLARRTAVMYLGQIVEEGPTREVFETPRHPYTKALLASIPSMDPEAPRRKPAIQGDPPSPISLPSGCYFHPRCPEVEGRCRTEVQHLKEVKDGRMARCWKCM